MGLGVVAMVVAVVVAMSGSLGVCGVVCYTFFIDQMPLG
jgi:hypothetical protein